MTDQPQDRGPQSPPGPVPGQPPYPGYPPYPPPYMYLPSMNVYAILSLVFAAMVFPPVGVFLGYKARKQIAQTGERGSELATAGIVVGWILTCLYGLFFVIWCAFVGVALLGLGGAN